jgi:hypothetical protein
MTNDGFSENRAASKDGAQGRPRRKWKAASLFFGVVSPLLCLLLGLATGGSILDFDPVPRVTNGLLIALAALTNVLLCYLPADSCRPQMAILIAFLGGMTLVTTGLYGLCFLPYAPLGLLGLLVIVGIFVLTPPLAFLAFIFLWRRLPWLKVGGPMAWLSGASGCLLALLLLLGPEWNDHQDRITFEKINGTVRDDDRREAIRKARELPRGVLMKAALQNPPRGLWFDGGIFESCIWARSRNRRALSPEDYFKISGRLIQEDSAAVARRAKNSSDFGAIDGEESFFSWKGKRRDSGLGRGRLPFALRSRLRDWDALQLEGSALEGSVDLVGASAYLEWNFSVTNQSWTPGEGWFEIVVPPGASVSRASLRVGDQRREAAFAASALARKAYFTISRVSPREALNEGRALQGQLIRDPLLVEEVAPDRVRLRFAPVPSRGEMRFLIGMSVPLEVTDLDRVRLRLPAFFSGNVRASDDLVHHLWIETGDLIIAAGAELVAEAEEGEIAVLKAALKNSEHPGLAGLRFDMKRLPIERCWAELPKRKRAWSLKPAEHELVQTLVARVREEDRRVLVAVDPSSSMQAEFGDLSAVLENADPKSIAAVVLGGDEVEVHDLKGALSALAEFGARGGYSNEALLVRSLHVAAARGIDRLIWIHGDQPFELGPRDELAQCLRRGHKLPELVALAAGRGRNTVVSFLQESEKIDAGCIAGGLETAGILAELLKTGGSGHARLRRELAMTPSAEIEAGLPRARADLFRIYASRKSRSLTKTDGKRAAQVAAAAGIVTRVTSAVCLEREAQYDQFGLLESKSDELPTIQVPTIPEPEEWALIIVAALSLLLLLRRRGGA